MTTNYSPLTHTGMRIRSAIKAWRDHKRMIDSTHTIRDWMHEARDITGEQFSARDYDAAIEALDRWIASRPPAARD